MGAKGQKTAPSSGFKVLTHNFCSPIQGGAAVWDGATLPFALPMVTLNKSDEECAAGWNYTETLASALRVAGLWQIGRPSCCVTVDASKDRIRRGDKLRCSQLTITQRIEREGIRAAILELSTDVFRMGDLAEHMTDSQLAWYDALDRPLNDPTAVEKSLSHALEARNLNWTLRRYEAATDAWDATDAWGAWDAWDGRDGRGAWDAWRARAELGASDAWGVLAARAAWGAWGGRDGRGAWRARAALAVEYASLRGWFEKPSDLLTVGLREAYLHGLAVAVPIEKGVLGWAMD